MRASFVLHIRIPVKWYRNRRRLRIVCPPSPKSPSSVVGHACLAPRHHLVFTRSSFHVTHYPKTSTRQQTSTHRFLYVLTTDSLHSATPLPPTDEGASLASDRGEATAATAAAAASAFGAPFFFGGCSAASASAVGHSITPVEETPPPSPAGGGSDAPAAASSCVMDQGISG